MWSHLSQVSTHTHTHTASFNEFFTKGRYSALGIGQATAPVSRAHQDSRPLSWGSHIHTHTHMHRHIQAQKCKGFPHEYNIQVVLASCRGRWRALISVVQGTMLQSGIAIDLFPSDLSGPEVVTIFRDLALSVHTQGVLMSGVTQAYDNFG